MLDIGEVHQTLHGNEPIVFQCKIFCETSQVSRKVDKDSDCTDCSHDFTGSTRSVAATWKYCKKIKIKTIKNCHFQSRGKIMSLVASIFSSVIPGRTGNWRGQSSLPPLPPLAQLMQERRGHLQRR